MPTGNFGDIFAGEAAARMGLAMERLVIATNPNDIMARALNDGVYASGAAHHTFSPSMDIQVASNFERALFEASAATPTGRPRAMDDFARDRKLVLPPKILGDLRARYSAFASNDDETLATIKRVMRRDRHAFSIPTPLSPPRLQRKLQACHSPPSFSPPPIRPNSLMP